MDKGIFSEKGGDVFKKYHEAENQHSIPSDTLQRVECESSNAVRVNGQWIVTGFATPEGVTEETIYEMAAGDTMEVLAQWVKDGSVDSGRDCAEISFISEGDFSIEKTELSKTVSAGGSNGGWPQMILKRELTPAVFLRILIKQGGELTEFSEELWCGLLDYATAYADGCLTFTFKNGSTFEG